MAASHVAESQEGLVKTTEGLGPGIGVGTRVSHLRRAGRMQFATGKEREGEWSSACRPGWCCHGQAGRLQRLSHRPGLGAGIQYGIAEDPH